MPKRSLPTILITVDVEDWFQVENFRPWISPESWADRQLRVERNVHRLLDLLDGFEATFFVLGWVAERLPELVRQISNRGHEVASHGYNHRLCSDMASAELEQDLIRSKHLLEDITATEVVGYRAPSFSIDNRTLAIVEQCGYRYDSSYNSFEANPRYGRLKLSPYAKNGRGLEISAKFRELPMSNLKLLNRTLPWSGGGYFRLLPYRIFRQGLRKILLKQGYYLFYLHPWEIDHRQQRVSMADHLSRFRHYCNLKSTYHKLHNLIQDNADCHFSGCWNFIKSASHDGSETQSVVLP